MQTTATEQQPGTIVTVPGQGAALALAARKTALLGELLAEEDQPALAQEWDELLERLDESPRRAAILIAFYRGRIEAALARARRAARDEGP